MALEWTLLAYVVGAEAIILLVVTMPVFEHLRKGLISVSRSALQPLLSIIPLCLFLLLDIYWKLERMPKCEGPECSVMEQIRHSKSMMKSQRNIILVLAALLLYWLLNHVTRVLIKIDALSQQTKQLKQQHQD